MATGENGFDGYAEWQRNGLNFVLRLWCEDCDGPVLVGQLYVQAGREVLHPECARLRLEARQEAVDG